jgi:hypothetical protein
VRADGAAMLLVVQGEVDPTDWTIFRGRIFAPEAAPIERDFT